MSRSYSGEAELTQHLNDTGRHSSRDANPKRSPINRQTLSSIARISAYSGTKYNMTIGLHASDDPLTQAMRPRSDETSAERTRRLREEEEALKRSKEIDQEDTARRVRDPDGLGKSLYPKCKRYSTLLLKTGRRKRGESYRIDKCH